MCNDEQKKVIYHVSEVVANIMKVMQKSSVLFIDPTGILNQNKCDILSVVSSTGYINVVLNLQFN